MKRRWIFWLIMLAFVYLVINRLGEIENLARTLVRGQWQWILAAVVLQGAYYTMYATLYQAAFYAVDIRLPRIKLVPVMFAAIFMDVAAPTGGASSAAVLVNEAAYRGHSPARGTAAVLLGRVTDFSTFLVILLIGLTYLLLQNQLRTYELVMAGILLLYIGSMSGVLLLGRRDPVLLRRILHRIQKIANGAARIVGLADPLPANWGEQAAAEFTEAALAIAIHPERATGIMAAAAGVYLLHMTCLYVLFLAFRYPIGVGPLIGGYSIGMLFWIVSITPHGIGVVEGVMVLLYTSLGVPRETATVVVLSFRGLTFWIPLAIGFFAVRRLRSLRVQRPKRRYNWLMQVTAGLAVAVALLNVVSAAMPAISIRLATAATLWPLEVRRGGRLAVVLAGFVMLTLANDLRRGRRVAWAVAVFMLLISIVGQVLKALDYEPAIATGLALVWLVALRSRFNARAQPPTLRHGLVVTGLAVLFTLAYGAIGFNILPNQFSRNYPLGPAIWQSIALWTQFWASKVRPLTSFARFFVSSVYVVGLASLGYGLLITGLALLRRTSSAEERARAADIVRAYAGSEEGYYALLPDKRHWFSPAGSLVAYTVKGRVAVALAEPIGPPGDVEEAVSGFRADMAARGLQAVFYLAHAERLPVYQAAGFETLEVGLQGEVALGPGASARTLRALKATCARRYRTGYRTELYAPRLQEGLLAEMGAVSDEWLAITGEMEKRFATGWFQEDYVQDRPVMIATDDAGAIAGFATLIVDERRRAVSVDLIRRRRSADPGLMEFLWAAVLLWAREEQYECVNLGMAPMPDRPTSDPVRHYLQEHVTATYGPRGAESLRERVRPHWSPRYLVYPDEASLPAVLSALVRADSGEDFLWDKIADSIARRLAPVRYTNGQTQADE